MATKKAKKQASKKKAPQPLSAQKRSQAARKGWEKRKQDKAAQKRSLAARKGWETRRRAKNALLAQTKRAKEKRSASARRGWAKRRAKQSILSAFNDPRARAFGLTNVFAENGRVMAVDSKGTKRQLYTIRNKETGETVYRWGNAKKLEGYDPITFSEAYDVIDPDLYEVTFEFIFE